MKIVFCWRCQMEIPMLDEAEFAAAFAYPDLRIALSSTG
jgi:hypothetical protein